MSFDAATERKIADLVATFAHDPPAFTRAIYPWGQAGTVLEHEDGPDEWQTGILGLIREGAADVATALRIAVASGHGIGKTALCAWIIHWFISTRPNPQIVVTSNTGAQLRDKTWRELSKWQKLALNGHWFDWTAKRYALKQRPDTWFATAATWATDKAEAFQGTHERHVLMIFDEASAIPDAIWDAAEGSMTTEGAMWIAFGNPTRNTGRFKECFPGGRQAHRWRTMQVDSRTARHTNKAEIQRWVDDYGEDSDFVRVRVRGIFPRAGSMQFIPGDIVEAAQKREAACLLSDPVCIGVDAARFGDDRSVIYIRRGRDGRTWPPVIRREIDTMTLAGLVAEIAAEQEADAVCVDAGGIGSGVIDRLRQLNVPNVYEVHFGGKPEGYAPEGGLPLHANRAAEMWSRMKEWLKGGAIIDTPEMASDLTGREYGFDAKNSIQLERKEDMKKRGLASPDLADALALTFAVPVAPRSVQTLNRYGQPLIGQSGYVADTDE